MIFRVSQSRSKKKSMTEGRILGYGGVTTALLCVSVLIVSSVRCRRYKKRLVNKDLSTYSKNDIKCILGGNKGSEPEPAVTLNRPRTRSMDKAEKAAKKTAKAEKAEKAERAEKAKSPKKKSKKRQADEADESDKKAKKKKKKQK